MSEYEVTDILDLMLESIRMVQERFSKIGMSEDFVSTSDGVTLLDAISIRLQVIGESVKQIQKTDISFLHPHAEIEWDKVARFRDLVSHHYEHVDHEIVYDICQNLQFILQQQHNKKPCHPRNLPARALHGRRVRAKNYWKLRN